MYRNKKHYLCLEDWGDGIAHVSYCSYKPLRGKNRQCKWYKGYDTAIGYEAYKELSSRIGKKNFSIEYAKHIAKDVVKRYKER